MTKNWKKSSIRSCSDFPVFDFLRVDRSVYVVFQLLHALRSHDSFHTDSYLGSNSFVYIRYSRAPLSWPGMTWEDIGVTGPVTLVIKTYLATTYLPSHIHHLLFVFPDLRGLCRSQYTFRPLSPTILNLYSKNVRGTVRYLIKSV